MNAAAHLEVNDLRTYLFTRWGVVKALDGVSLSIDQGETLALVGESGCGKSTFCHSILRVLPAAGRIVSGQIWLEGEDLVAKSEPEMRKIRGSRISMILQDPMTSLDPVFTVGSQLAETVGLGGNGAGRPAWERAAELLRLVRIPAPADRLRHYPHQFSGGMRQRVSGAIALARQPGLLIADEPTSALDVITQASYLRLLKDVQRQAGLTLIFVTHDFGIVARICDRVGVMYAGKLVEVGDVRAMFNRPRHPYTKALLESVPSVDVKVARLTSIEGQPPTLHDLPAGCAFAPRCSVSTDVCREQYPPTITVEDGHEVACWRHS